MEMLWADMAGNEKELESPAWHGEILNEREAALNAGKVAVSSWQEAKERIQKSLMRVKILSTAESDLEEGHRFYEAQADGLGTYFLDTLYSH